jgi:glycopeptide antibiotics resistance protein
MGFKTPRNITLPACLKQKSGLIWFLLAVLSVGPLLPLSNFAGHPHWDLIQWIPFQNFNPSRNMLTDVIGNILWFMAFGYLLHYQLNEDSASLWTIAVTTAIAGGISLSTEFFQVFCHSRFPSMTDVICNVLGAGIGGYVAKKPRTTAATELWPTTCLSKVTGLKRFNKYDHVYGQTLPLD